jgi:hypothetical protein
MMIIYAVRWYTGKYKLYWLITTVKTSYWSSILYGWHPAHLLSIQLPSSLGSGWALEAKESVERAAFIVKLFRGAGIIVMRFVGYSRFLISICSVNLRFEPIAAAALPCPGPRALAVGQQPLVPSSHCVADCQRARSRQALYFLQHVFT